ncbi:CAP domain-containing protein [Lactobacillus sp. ESL0791]|uniref:CAP domain-containing protein n=1 Tax=Lactobacillus sp. ESL0791 TaxID=2983234 RepID=UPI0023F904F3|nr:CAP domain-containing protein [Lactobacillus sp. ESL0791]MDF7639736.1 CAP domain-containing protein [Lactobacillus sp. ESL0791]
MKENKYRRLNRVLVSVFLCSGLLVTTVMPNSIMQVSAKSKTTQLSYQQEFKKMGKENKRAKKAIKNASLAQYRATFLKELNKERAKRNIKPLKEKANYDAATQARSAELKDNYSHTDKAGQTIYLKYFKNAGINPTASGECLSEEGHGDFQYYRYPKKGIKNKAAVSTAGITKVSSKLLFHPYNSYRTWKKISTADIAKLDLYKYIYDDAASNWGHRDNLLNKNYTKIGIGLVTVAKEGLVRTAIDLSN